MNMRVCVCACLLCIIARLCLEDTVECVEDRDGVVIIDQYLCDKTLCVTFVQRENLDKQQQHVHTEVLH